MNARLTLLAASLTVAFAGHALAAAPAGQSEALARLKAETANGADVTFHPATGAARFVRIHGNGVSNAARGRAATDAAKHGNAQQFLSDYGALFGLTNPSTELTAGRLVKDRLGHAHITRQQLYKGVPVFGGELRSHFDGNGGLTAVNGTFVPGIDLDVTPRRTGAQAIAHALANVRARVGQSAALSTSQPQLMVYREGLLKGVEGANRLVWQVTVGNGKDVREFLFIDAHSGKVVDQFNGIHDAKNRRAFNAQNLAQPGPNYPNNPFWVEGQNLPTNNTEADNMIFASGEIYDLFKKAFGRDSFDGNGATMDSIFNRGNGCPNASWNGVYISFCPGTTTDDITAHEWGHAYTEYTHGLIYAWQPGALNEAYSDIWGETVDRINGRQTDTPDNLRTAGSCSVATVKTPTVTVNSSPNGLASPTQVGFSQFGPQGYSLTADVMAATPLNGCSAISTNLTGKIAYIDRGTCTFASKTKAAQDAGAIGVIIGNSATGTFGNMGGSGNAAFDATITIPAVMIPFSNAGAFKTSMGGGTVNATMARFAGTDNSVRWLLGEDSSAFGGAIRDMYTPSCYGQPAKVSDASYTCGAQATSDNDNGGVHQNSGIPNHAYALLVDGGTFNSQTVTGIGLTKAAHIYWRAQSVYQGPATNFAAHADALEASCQDLIGASLNGLTTGTPSGEVISAADCTQVANAMLAVEMRSPPAQCGFQPMLAKSPPPLCATGTPTSVITDTFDGGRRTGLKWTVSNAGTVAGDFIQRNWGVTNMLPPGRSGYAMYAPAPDFSCTTDQSAVLRLESPEFTVPAGASLKMSFDHWMASEAGWDGGNLKISVNGGAWQLVQASDFIYNPYNLTLKTAAAQNSNPLAGEPAFSGTDSNEVTSSWGRSIINLAPYAAPGAKVKLRFEMGVDSCGGNTGWFVDDVNVYRCTP